MTALDPTQPDQPIRKSAQRLRWFVTTFADQVARTERETGNSYAVDAPKLAQVFAEWIRAFDAQKPSRIEDKAAYVGFAAGLMLRTLVQHNPVTLGQRPDGADTSNPAYFWPEGYLYVAFCLNVRGLVIEQDFAGVQALSDAVDDTRTWWTFKENVDQDPRMAIAFLDLFAGEEPNWDMPELFQSGQAARLAPQFFTPRIGET